METAEIRRRFLGFFADRGHTVVPSAPLLLDDPNLLFVNAGMVPFKPFFLGQASPPYRRATSVQKCVRTQDIEEVGKTTRHGTFFQMNGNFSFGDYFKQGAIELAWELSTRPVADGGFGLPEHLLWVTVLADDDESIDIWKRVAGLPDERIVRRGPLDNYWHMGVPGPGGPCSEIYLDRGRAHGPDGGPEVDEDRYLEFWNLVFMQHELSAVRAKDDVDIAGDLPAKNIDTGLGLERMAYLLQGVENLYETDEVYPVIARAAELAGKHYGRGDTDKGTAAYVDDVRLRVVGDHVRSALMLVGDGVTPGNEARGYVLRRLLRRAVWSMRLLGVDEPVLPELLPVSLSRMEQSYPELRTGWDRISAVVYAEEEAFRATLRAGTQLFDLAAADTRRSGTAALPGDAAFRLHDTYGFPIDLTLEMAAEQGLAVDEDGFRRLMAEQRRRAKADAKAKKSGHVDLSVYRAVADRLGRQVEFLGYERLRAEATVVGLVLNDEPSASAGTGADVEVILDRTPFYAEGGGQQPDTGRILLDGAELEVFDVQSPIDGLVVHRAHVVAGEVVGGAAVEALVDVGRRGAISRSHTATHMVHKAFREALGETAAQAGSENAPGRFRFDFGAKGPVPPSVLSDVEARVNSLVVDDLLVTAEYLSLDEARRSGAMALFGEKYGATVRVVSVGDWARELCGGTHVDRSGKLGVVSLLGESSIGQGVRRVEALVGHDAYRYLAREHVLLHQLTELVKGRPEELPERIAGVLARLKDAERELARLRSAQLTANVAGLTGEGTQLGDLRVWAFRAPDGLSGGELRELVMSAAGQARPELAVTALAASVSDGASGKVSLVAVANPRARDLGVSATQLLRAALPAVAGRGGGKDDVAQGGGTDPAGLDAAIAAFVAAAGQAAGVPAPAPDAAPG